MILSELQDYLAVRRRATLADLATRFAVDPGAMRGMLDRLVGKGRVAKRSAEMCAGCTRCDPVDFEVYEWLGRSRPGHGAPPTG